ncbi:MAG: hypothetical protein AB7V55_00860 [Oscillospiraceae bacterium]
MRSNAVKITLIIGIALVAIQAIIWMAIGSHNWGSADTGAPSDDAPAE